MILDATQFVLLFFSVFIGAMVVTFNTRVLGGQISYLQSVAILGYCLFPLFIAALVVQVMRFVQFFNRWVRLACILAATFWCILCISLLIQHQELLWQSMQLKTENLQHFIQFVYFTFSQEFSLCTCDLNNILKKFIGF